MSNSIHEEAERLRRKIEEDQNKKLKIALFEQPGDGKSSLINSIVGKKLRVQGFYRCYCFSSDY